VITLLAWGLWLWDTDSMVYPYRGEPQLHVTKRSYGC